MPIHVIKRHRCQTSITALQLAEDTKLLEVAIDILDRLQVDSLGDNRDEVAKEVWSLRQLLNKWKRYARTKLNSDYLKS